MFILFSILYGCSYTYSLNTDPIHVEKILKTNETICVNTSQFYSTFVFNTLGNSSFTIFDSTNRERHLGLEEEYTKASGVNFGKIVGSFLLTAKSDSYVSFAATVFPKEECEIKIVTNYIREYVYLNFENCTICYFNGNGNNFRYKFDLSFGTIEIRGPNKSIMLQESHKFYEIHGYTPLILYKPNHSSPYSDSSFFAVGSNNLDPIRKLTQKIISSEPLLIGSNLNYDCVDNLTDLDYIKSLKNEKMMKTALMVVLQITVNFTAFFYLFSLCYVCPCCCCYNFCHTCSCCSCCCCVTQHKEPRLRKKHRSKKHSKSKSKAKSKNKKKANPQFPENTEIELDSNIGSNDPSLETSNVKSFNEIV
ncbi:hypothetical protein TRFO_16854 [Tritrichomonas foetus]|uniref:Tubby C-terminal domain-containing protein n=1 Tax=Tritrichomonas foetus TaxID=1144522 RepID=A0A1J4KTW3_9EUKA|nr:hypothetical protein TRFO_16854 [Tritrichomonas foetus]|eukprot:OHT13102.1 hypothetical protein TRFO_16854 [Tritrichomonas foetus]